MKPLTLEFKVHSDYVTLPNFHHSFLSPTVQTEQGRRDHRSGGWKWKLLSHVQLCDPMDYTVHGILQARILKWVAIPFSRGSSPPRDWIQVSHIAGGFFTRWATNRAEVGWKRGKCDWWGYIGARENPPGGHLWFQPPRTWMPAW